MVKWAALLAVIMVLMAAGQASATESENGILLAENGKARAAIVIKDDARTPKLAALLEAHLAQISGAHLPILTTKKLGKATVADGRLAPQRGKIDPAIASFILLGDNGLSRQIVGDEIGKLGPGGVRIKTSGNVVILLGKGEGEKSPGGDVYAIYQFLEALGCRWLWPGESGKVMPHLETLAAPALDVNYSPPLIQRKIRFSNFEKTLTPASEAVMKRMGMDVESWRKAKTEAAASQAGGEWREWQGLGGDLNMSGGHNGAGLGSDGWEKYGKTHPEWFALQADGTRDQSAAGDRWRECVSNPGLIDAVANKIIEEVRRRPTGCVSLSPNDGGKSSFCLCENCRKLDPPKAPKIQFRVFKKVGQSERKYIEYPSLSDRFVWYWGQVAERVTKVHPNLLFSIDAYSVYQTPPVRQKVHPNMVLRYVPSDMEGWTGWQKAGAKRIYWRPNILYHGSNEGTLNRSTARQIAETMNRLIDLNMIGTDMDSCLDDWATMGLNYYVAARVNWNPRLKFEEIVEDYCRAGFGKAAGPVKRYFERVDALRDPATKEFGETSLEQYTPQAIEALRGVLDEAGKAAGDDAALKRRVEFLRCGLEFTALTADAARMRREAVAGRAVDLKAAAGVLERRATLMREIAMKEPMALNVPYIAAYDAILWKPLKWKGPQGAK